MNNIHIPWVLSWSLLNFNLTSQDFFHITSEFPKDMTMIHLSDEQMGICQERLWFICIFSIYESNVQVRWLGYKCSWSYLFLLSPLWCPYCTHHWLFTLLNIPRTQDSKVPNAKGRRKLGTTGNCNIKESDQNLRYHVNWIKCHWWHNYQIDAFFLLYFCPVFRINGVEILLLGLHMMGWENLIKIMDMRKKLKEITKTKMFQFSVKCMYWCSGIHYKKL